MAETTAAQPLRQPTAPTRLGMLTLHKLPDVLAILILSIGALLMILPFMWMFSTSLRPIQESYKLPPAWFPTEFHWETYLAVLQSSVPIFTFAANSIKVTLLVTVGQLITCSMAGYAFARLRFPFRNALFLLLLASLMVPGQVTIIPVFIIMRQLGLVDNHLSIILPFLTSAFGVFLLRQFFLTLPQDLIDAAKIDGAGPWITFLRVALPLAGPSLAALTIITFNNTWNNYFYPLIFLNTWEKMTLPLGITALRGYLASNSASVVMAAVSLAILPVLLVFLFAQRWFIAGITRTGIKG
jgi:multiple sugar transport system permease protein